MDLAACLVRQELTCANIAKLSCQVRKERRDSLKTSIRFSSELLFDSNATLSPQHAQEGVKISPKSVTRNLSQKISIGLKKNGNLIETANLLSPNNPGTPSPQTLSRRKGFENIFSISEA